MDDSAEDHVWRNINANELWALDKLILSRKLGYNCGPTGLDVPVAGVYIVRPCVNMLGLGLGAQQVWLDKETMHLPIGHKESDTFIHWDKWIRTNDKIPLPFELRTFAHHKWINVEYIDNKVIEIHFRHNEDFDGNIDEFIPVWEGECIIPPSGYTYRDYPDIHGRIGAFVK